MKKFIYILTLFSFTFVNAQIISIPDVMFKQALLLSNTTDQQVAFDIQGNPMAVDANQDGEIQETEALAVYGLDLSGNENGLILIEGNPIYDLTGLNYFLNLKDLDISTNALTGQTFNATIFNNLVNFSAANSSLSGVVVSNMATLKKIDVTGNNLTEINVTGLTALEELIVDSNQITNLDFSTNLALRKLNARANLISTLNWSQLTQLTDLNISFCENITSVDVSTLINLRVFDVNDTGITSLDVSNNLLLTDLNCSKNANSNFAISSIDVSMLQNLQTLQCASNQLTSLNVSGLQNLTYLNCNDNNISNLVFGNNQNLIGLDCSINQISNLDLSLFPLLQQLSCDKNNFANLDFSTLENLSYVSCSDNQFQSLDFSNNPRLNYLDLGTSIQLEYLNLKNNTNEFFSFILSTSLPNLVFVCADENEINIIQSMLFGLNQNVVINSYCSFVPGGNFNTITGNVSFDLNQDGCDANDAVQSFVKVTINDGTNEGSIFTDELGNYKFYVQEGEFTLSMQIENNTLFTVNGQNTQVEFLDVNNNTANASFCIVPSGNQSDLEVVISPFSYPLLGGENYYQVFYRNKGNQTLSGNINFSYNTSLASFQVAQPVQTAINSDGSLDFAFSNLLPFESRAIIVGLNLNGPSSPNPLQAGDILQFTANGNIATTDANPADNQFVYNQTVEQFMIENSIICVEGQEVNPNLIGDYLHYAVNFENTTNETSSFIVLRATINPDQFDISSLQLLMSSSNVEVRVTGNLLEIIFTNLQLETGGHGNVLLKIRTTNNLLPGDRVEFETAVFFNEVNYATTNRAITTFRTGAILGNDSFDKVKLSVYPNPTKSNINIVCDTDIKSVELFDLQGRLLQKFSAIQNQAIINMSKQLSGVYFIKVNTDKGIKVEKVIKE